MKIISTGKLPDKQSYRATCRKCRTIFEFQRFEAEYIPDNRDGGFLKIKCPLNGCNNNVAVRP